jgi:transposase-like protein
MNCPNCHSKKIRKNGHRRGKQNYQCKEWALSRDTDTVGEFKKHVQGAIAIA